jgi:hypothetical protein
MTATAIWSGVKVSIAKTKAANAAAIVACARETVFGERARFDSSVQ